MFVEQVLVLNIHYHLKVFEVCFLCDFLVCHVDRMVQYLYCIFLLQDFDGDVVTMAFTVNGEMQGMAYSITHSDLQNRALFPHILSKNTKFRCNFGVEKLWFPPPEDYTCVAHVPLDQRVSGAKRPEKREDCEVHFSFVLEVIHLRLDKRVFDNLHSFFASSDDYDVWSAWQWEDSLG